MIGIGLRLALAGRKALSTPHLQPRCPAPRFPSPHRSAPRSSRLGAVGPRSCGSRSKGHDNFNPDGSSGTVAGIEMFTTATARACRVRHLLHTLSPMERKLVSSGALWEPLVGYSRAVRVGQWISVAGTTAAAEGGGAVGGDDIGEQTREALRRIAAALREVGAEPKHVVRTRIFLTDISRWEEVGRAHGEMFATIRPATSMVEVRSLIDPALLVEIEADAIVTEDDH